MAQRIIHNKKFSIARSFDFYFDVRREYECDTPFNQYTNLEKLVNYIKQKQGRIIFLSVRKYLYGDTKEEWSKNLWILHIFMFVFKENRIIRNRFIRNSFKQVLCTVYFHQK